jgi:hypothetical protein
MDYDECYKIISVYTPKVLPLFADGWSRFPDYPNAGKIINELDNALSFYTRHNPESHGEIIHNLKLTIKSIAEKR